MTVSYDEAARAYAKSHRVALDVAYLAVAELYTEEDRTSDDQRRSRLDRVAADDGLVHHAEPRRRAGRVVSLDSTPSPAAVTAKSRAIAAAKADGDHYRNLSRNTSVHRAEP